MSRAEKFMGCELTFPRSESISETAQLGILPARSVLRLMLCPRQAEVWSSGAGRTFLCQPESRQR